MHVRVSFAFLSLVLLGALLTTGTHYARRALSATAALPATPDPALPPLPAIFQVLEMRPARLDDADRAHLATLRLEFDDRLDDPRAQVQMLERLGHYVHAQHAFNRRDVLVRFLKEAFPVRAPELFARSLKLARYREWLDATHTVLATLPVEQRRAALWAARRQAFGDDAERIWAAELRHLVPVGTAVGAP